MIYLFVYYCLLANGNISTFNLDDIRNHKQLVLTTIKSAVVEGGEILLEIFTRVSRILPSNLSFPNHAHLLSSELSTGFVQIIRKYHFTYIDSSTIQIEETSDPSSTTNSNSNTNSNPNSNPNPNPSSNSTKSTTTSTGKKNYFKYLTPTVSPSLLIRSFSQHPIDSLLRGVFLTLDEGEKFRLVCIRYSRALEKISLQNKKHSSNTSQFSLFSSSSNISQSKLQSNEGSIYLQTEEILITNSLNNYSKNILESLENGEFVQSGRWMLNLQSLLSFTHDELFNNRTILNQTAHHKSKKSIPVLSLYDKSSHCIKQIASLSGQSIGKLYSAREIIDSYISCVNLFIVEYLESCTYFTETIEETNKKKKKQNDVTVDTNDNLSLKRDSILFQYDSIRLSLLEIKNIIYGIYRDRYLYNSCELMTISEELIHIIDSLFSDTHTMNCILPSLQLLTKSNLVNTPNEIIKSLKVIIDPLTQISFGLKFIISSLGGQILLELLQMDLDSKYHYNNTPAKTTVLFNSNENEQQFMISRPPLTFTELIGKSNFF